MINTVVAAVGRVALLAADEIGVVFQGLSWADAGGPARGWTGPGRPARPGPSIFYMMARGLARPIKFNLVGRGPARPVKFSKGGPRPDPAHQIFRGLAAARPSPSHFQEFTARPIIFSKVSARPGPAHHMAARPMRHGLYMGRPMCCRVLRGACACADVIFLR